MIARRVVVLSGIPGSGKSRHARQFCSLRDSAEIVSADDFFTHDGVYAFNAAKLSEAHADCFRRFLEALRTETALVVVDNTNMRALEIAPYMLAAAAHGYEAEVVRFVVPATVGAARNTHGVSLTRCHQMAENMEPLPAWWRLTIVDGAVPQ